MQKKTGFTLAEVMVTLAVIGVVATLTIPGLIQSYQKLEYVTRLQKNYKMLNEVVSMIQVENDGTLIGFANNNNEVKDAFLKYLRYMDNCDLGSCLGNLWHDNTTSKNLDGSYISAWSEDPVIKFHDSSAWYFRFFSPTCSGIYHGNINNVCFGLTMDVNGIEKDPNTRGRDIFEFFITRDKVHPLGSGGDTTVGSCNTSSNGWGCTGRVIIDGWKMDY